MAYQLVTAPTVEPLTLAEVKRFLKVDFDEEDADIKGMITAAREFCETMLDDRALITQTWDWVMSEFPDGDSFKVPKAPLQSITSITYYDTANASQTFSSSNYTTLLDARQGGRVHLVYGQSWPAVYSRPNAVTIRFVAGYGAASAVPYSVKQAMRMLCHHWHYTRDPVLTTGAVSSKIAMSVEALLGNNAVGTYA